MLGRDKRVKDVVDYLRDVSDATMIAALAELDFIVTRAVEESSAPDDVKVLGSIKITDATARPISRIKVSVRAVLSDYSITSPSTGEVIRPCLTEIPVHKYTDGSGTASFTLIKGSSVIVQTSLSAVTRELTVPDADFDLLDPLISSGQDYLSDPAPPRTTLMRGDV